jgi:hypothetical protein
MDESEIPQPTLTWSPEFSLMGFKEEATARQFAGGVMQWLQLLSRNFDVGYLDSVIILNPAVG